MGQSTANDIEKKKKKNRNNKQKYAQRPLYNVPKKVD